MTSFNTEISWNTRSLCVCIIHICSGVFFILKSHERGRKSKMKKKCLTLIQSYLEFEIAFSKLTLQEGWEKLLGLKVWLNIHILQIDWNTIFFRIRHLIWQKNRKKLQVSTSFHRPLKCYLNRPNQGTECRSECRESGHTEIWSINTKETPNSLKRPAESSKCLPYGKIVSLEMAVNPFKTNRMVVWTATSTQIPYA